MSSSSCSYLITLQFCSIRAILASPPRLTFVSVAFMDRLLLEVTTDVTCAISVVNFHMVKVVHCFLPLQTERHCGQNLR